MILKFFQVVAHLQISSGVGYIGSFPTLNGHISHKMLLKGWCQLMKGIMLHVSCNTEHYKL